MKITKVINQRACQCRACFNKTFTMHAQVQETIWAVEVPGSRWDREFATKKAATAFVASKQREHQT